MIHTNVVEVEEKEEESRTLSHVSKQSEETTTP